MHWSGDFQPEHAIGQNELNLADPEISDIKDKSQVQEAEKAAATGPYRSTETLDGNTGRSIAGPNRQTCMC